VRRSYGRDIWLSVRMAVALAIVGLIYLAAEAIALAIMLAGVVDRDVWTTITGLVLMLPSSVLSSSRCASPRPCC
jgi:hypothetical protein